MLQFQKTKHLPCTCLQRLLFSLEGGQPEYGTEESATTLHVKSGKQVFEHGAVTKDIGPLETADQTQFGYLMGLFAGNVQSEKMHGTGTGAHIAGDNIERRGFAGAIGADQTDDPAGFNPEVHVAENLQAGDAQADAGQGQ